MSDSTARRGRPWNNDKEHRGSCPEADGACPGGLSGGGVEGGRVCCGVEGGGSEAKRGDKVKRRGEWGGRMKGVRVIHAREISRNGLIEAVLAYVSTLLLACLKSLF